MANPRRNCPNLAKPSCGPTPAAFAEKTPAFECRAAPSPDRGGGGSRDPKGRSYSTCRTATNLSRKSSARRPPPLRLCKTPVGVPSGTRTGQPLPQAEDGDSTSRDTAPPFSAQIFPWRTDATRRTGLLLENRDRRSRAPPPPPAESRCRSARENWHLLRQARWRQPRNCSVVAPAPPNDHWPRAWAKFSPWRPVASPRDGSATFASLICARAGDGPKNRSAQQSLTARWNYTWRSPAGPTSRERATLRIAWAMPAKNTPNE